MVSTRPAPQPVLAGRRVGPAADGSSVELRDCSRPAFVRNQDEATQPLDRGTAGVAGDPNAQLQALGERASGDRRRRVLTEQLGDLRRVPPLLVFRSGVFLGGHADLSMQLNRHVPGTRSRAVDIWNLSDSTTSGACSPSQGLHSGRNRESGMLTLRIVVP